ncbi:hypothetical protein X975_24605, partial [Stegodyphus mimosarum]
MHKNYVDQVENYLIVATNAIINLNRCVNEIKQTNKQKKNKKKERKKERNSFFH